MFCIISIGTSIKDFHQEKRTKIFSEGCDTFGPKRPQLIGPTGQTVPNQLCSYGPMVPKNLVSMDKWSPTNLVPLDKWSLEYSVCPVGQAVMIYKYGDQIG